MSCESLLFLKASLDLFAAELTDTHVIANHEARMVRMLISSTNKVAGAVKYGIENVMNLGIEVDIKL